MKFIDSWFEPGDQSRNKPVINPMDISGGGGDLSLGLNGPGSAEMKND